jgi:DNA replication protein DnaC
MEVLFTFLADRYERRSMMITSNLVFSQWDRICEDAMTTADANDRLVYDSIIIELTGESYRVEHTTQQTGENVESAKARRGKPRKNAQ